MYPEEEIRLYQTYSISQTTLEGKENTQHVRSTETMSCEKQQKDLEMFSTEIT